MFSAATILVVSLAASSGPANSQPTVPAVAGPVRESPQQEQPQFTNSRAKLRSDINDNWLSSLPQIRKAYIDGDWPILAKLVIAADVNLDLAYFYLGRSAEGLGQPTAARIYYTRAYSAPGCVGPFERCHDFTKSDLDARLEIVKHLESKSSRPSQDLVLTLPQPIWSALSQEQRDKLENKYLVDVIPETNFGTIIQVQTVNESTPGSTAGSQLGAAYASAAYRDNAFRGPPQNWNYSATGQLTSTIAGAVIGSMLDKPAEQRFHVRYTIKSARNEIGYVDSFSADQFTHPQGICVQINPLRPISSDTCELTLGRVLSYHFGMQTTPSQNRNPTEGRSIEDRMRELKALYDKGLISREMFERKRDELLQAL